MTDRIDGGKTTTHMIAIDKSAGTRRRGLFAHSSGSPSVETAFGLAPTPVSYARSIAQAKARGSGLHHRSPLFLLVSIALIGVTILVTAGCVRRTMTITTDPQGARVFLNDQEIGRSKVTTDFLWYGDYDVIVRKEGYQTLQTNWDIKAPWYQLMPIDFFAEVLWPGRIHDQRSNHFVLQTQVIPSEDELISRAMETRMRAFDPRK